MSHKHIDISYSKLSENYIEIINYLGKFSDSFSVITNLIKPYSKLPPNCEHNDVLKDFELYMIDQIIGLKEWPGTIKASKDNHKVMNIYRCCKQTRSLLIKLPNIFLPLHNKLPEDICFYRGNNAWFATISHEKLAFSVDPTKNDIDIFKHHQIINQKEKA